MNNLLQNAINGNKEDFIKIISTVEKELYYIAKTKLNNNEDIKDVIQETILCCYENLSTVKNIKKFKSWVITILINKCNDLYRKNKRNVFLSYDDTNASDSLVVTNNYEEINNKIDFDSLLNILDNDEKPIFILFYSNQYKIKDIANTLNLNENTVKSKLKRAREKVKLFIERCDKNEHRIS